ncbi:hypothetical protein GCM10022270_06710 [Terriglobus aquaticus]
MLAAVIGCSHPLEVDLPPGYTGKVSVFCDRLADTSEPIQVGADGTAPKAVCPRSRQALSVVRGGQAIQPSTVPNWSTTGDGIVLAIEFDVR